MSCLYKPHECVNGDILLKNESHRTTRNSFQSSGFHGNRLSTHVGVHDALINLMSQWEVVHTEREHICSCVKLKFELHLIGRLQKWDWYSYFETIYHVHFSLFDGAIILRRSCFWLVYAFYNISSNRVLVQHAEVDRIEESSQVYSGPISYPATSCVSSIQPDLLSVKRNKIKFNDNRKKNMFSVIFLYRSLRSSRCYIKSEGEWWKRNA